MSQWAIRVDDILTESGNQTVLYTAGTPPLSIQAAGSRLTLAPGQIDERIAQLVEQAQGDPMVLLLYALIRWQALDATMSNLALVRGKTVTLDTASVQVLQVV